MHAIPTQAVLLWLRKARQDHHSQQFPELYQGANAELALKLRPLIVIATLFFTGARSQEICNLEQNDVIVTDGLVQYHFHSLKHGIPRDVPVLNRFLADLVETHRLAWPSSARSPFVFTVKQVHPYPRLLHRIVSTEFPGYSPHSFRHHFASLLASEGVPMPVIQQSLGHRYLNTTAIYLQSLATQQTSEIWSRFDAQLNQEVLFTE